MEVLQVRDALVLHGGFAVAAVFVPCRPVRRG